ncbi:MAG TPA: ribosome small subunit-dependent GTPase A [Flavobacteriia bacterium]|nr:ribosome small subunit-dependent GTPase A [Flavobacteriia bacterium]
MQGIITKSTGSWYSVLSKNQVFKCRIKGKFRIKGIKSTNPVTVGDVVDFDLEENSDFGIIHHIHPRKNYIIRKSVNLSKQTHIIASNIDQVFLFVTLNNPVTTTGFIDRFLASAEAYKIPVILLFNKVDSYDEEALKIKEKLRGIYHKIGYKILDVSATENINIEVVKYQMIDKVSLFAGHSGVGKSTLANKLDANLKLKTKEISQQHQQGQHTTTFAQMYGLPFGGFLIDTPGIKGFGVVDFEKEEVGDYFPEFFALKQYCKFHNCLHVNEPKCAVKEALENGEIATSRYKSYVQILEGDQEHYRTDNYDL